MTLIVDNTFRLLGTEGTMSQETLNFINEKRICAIVRGVASANIQRVGEALIAGGINLVEVTFDQNSQRESEDRLKSMEILSKEFKGELLVGAGTVMSVENVIQAKESGAKFILAPNVNRAVIEKAVQENLVAIPGAMTPSEIADAYQFGANIVKLFPAGYLGASYVKAVRGPINHIPLMAVGGVDKENMGDLFKSGCSSFGIGSNLVNAKKVEQGDFDYITETAREYVRVIQQVLE